MVKYTKIISMMVFYIILVAGLIIYFSVIRPPVAIKIHGTYMNSPNDITAVHLIDNDGKPFNRQNLLGHWTMLFFGFTHCPMICPTTLSLLNNMYKLLEKKLPDKQLPHIMLISVDPDRDSEEVLTQYVHGFNTQFTAARANVTDILAFEQQLHLVVSGNNPLNHSMDIILVNPDAKVQAYFSYPHQADELAKDYKAIVNQP